MSKDVAEMILKWWAGARFWTCGEYGDQNVFDEDPEFVRLAVQDWPNLARKYGVK